MDIANFNLKDNIAYDSHDDVHTALTLLQDVQMPVGERPRQPDTDLNQPRRQPDKVQNAGTGRYSTWNYPDGSREVRFVAVVDDPNSACSLTRYNANGDMEAQFTLSKVATVSIGRLNGGGVYWDHRRLTISRADGSERAIWRGNALGGSKYAGETFRDSNGRTTGSTISQDLADRQIKAYLQTIMR